METKRQYFSLVTERIEALKKEYNDLKQEYITASKKEEIKLEMKFLKYKIAYLEKIKDLPFYIVISELSRDQLREIRSSIGKLGLTLEETRAYLMEKLNLHDIPSLIKHSDMSCLANIDDYRTIMNLITIQKRNGNYKQQKRDLQRTLEIPKELCTPELYQVFGFSGITQPLFLYEIGHIKKRLSIYETKLEQAIKTINQNYKMDTIGEIVFYLQKIEDPNLSESFIKSHAKKVASRFPGQKTAIKSLLQPKQHKILKNASLKKRKKEEQEFVNCVVACYQKDDALPFFGFENIDFKTISKKQYCAMMEQIKQEAMTRRMKIEELSQSIRKKESEILNTARDYNLLQEEGKKNFANIINTNIPNFKEAWLHWIWQVPNLLEVFIKGHALAEVETLVEGLKEPFPYYKEEELIGEIVYTLTQKTAA